jgi:hypothetical protein
MALRSDINYSIEEYHQVLSAFTLYVTALDAIAYLGKAASKILNSQTKNWRSVIKKNKT